MKNLSIIKNKKEVWVLFIYALLFITVFNEDSFLFEIFPRADESWLFTAGKAWMNGMTPYVDFADSKGPLVWLIYGLGYLIDHDSYLGVYFMTIPFFFCTLL